VKHRLALALALLLAAPVVAAEPVKITADNFTVDQGNKSGTFTGSPTGAVRINTPAQEATGGRATFDPLTQILKLTENVTVLNAQGKVSGPELTINLASQTSTFEGGKGGRVTGVFTPQ